MLAMELPELSAEETGEEPVRIAAHRDRVTAEP
jgi:hypothetical protein